VVGNERGKEGRKERELAGTMEKRWMAIK